MKLTLPKTISETALERTTDYANYMIQSKPEFNGEHVDVVLADVEQASCEELPEASVDYINNIISFWHLSDEKAEELSDMLEEFLGEK